MAHTPASMTVVDPSAVSLPVSGLARAAALLLALFVLAGGMLVSFGTVLVAPLGMWIAARVQRRRGRVLRRGGSWLAAASATTLGLALLAAVAAWTAPTGTWSHTRAAMDSASVAGSAAPPPAWLQRIVPAVRAPVRPHRYSPALAMGLVIWSMGLGIVMFGALLGTVGWLAGLLFGFAGTGRWPGAKLPADSLAVAD